MIYYLLYVFTILTVTRRETNLFHLCILVSSGYSLSVYMMLTVSLAKVKPLFGRQPPELRVTYFLKTWVYIRK